MTSSFVTRFDFRLPGVGRAERAEFYARALDIASYVEESGDIAIIVSEHHASDDGYLPSPLVLASAIAARTRTVPIQVAALLANLHDQLRMAEDMAVLDLLPGGRVAYTAGSGYREEEYAMFDRPWSSRGRDLDRNLRAILDAWTGEPFSYEGRTVRVQPTPASTPLVFVGGGSPAAARRAARFGLGFAPQVRDPELKEIYQQACRDLGREPGWFYQPPRGPASVFVTDDPDAWWDAYGHLLLADAQAYAAWQTDSHHHVIDRSSSVGELRAAGRHVVVTPDEAIARCNSGEWPVITSHPLCGGLPPEPGWESLRLLREVVRPALASLG